MNLLLAPPSLDDFIRLLKAWRFWTLGALIGAALGAALYVLAPPPYRAQAVVNVDFNLESAFPENSDRQDFYYLEREARKMVELAWSDEVLESLGAPVADLRGGALTLAQPAEAGWRFYADDAHPQKAAALASAWANAFVERVRAEIRAGNLNEFIRLEAVQTQNLPVKRSVPLSRYLLVGAFGFLTFAALGVLFVKPK
ncbi:MAG: hypothetical protein LC099_09740 [Anaerolineales bacterium]|nr:hypothetical protein [Anaerolineales bacterium]